MRIGFVLESLRRTATAVVVAALCVSAVRAADVPVEEAWNGEPLVFTDPFSLVPATAIVPRGPAYHGRFRSPSGRVPLIVTGAGRCLVLSNATTQPTFEEWCTGAATTSTFLVGDFDGNLRDDLLEVTTSGDWKVRLSSGVGFHTVTTWLTGQVPTGRLFVGDFTGEGLDDVAVIAHAELKYKVAVANPTAAPAPRFDLETWLTGYGQTSLNLVGDFSGDGRADLLIGFPGSPTASYWVARATGAHTFVFELWLGSTPVSPVPADAGVIGDFDNDGFDDVLLMNQSTFQWHILRSNAGAFTPILAFGGVGAPDGTHSQVGDFNGDGRSDVAYVSGSTVGQVLSQGTYFTGAASVLPLGLEGTRLFVSNLDPGSGFDDAEDVLIPTNGGAYLGHSTNLAAERYLVGRHTPMIPNGPGTLSSTFKMFQHPSSTPLFLKEVVQGTSNGGYAGAFAVDTCVGHFPANAVPTLADDVTCGFQSQSSGASPVPTVPTVPIPADGIPVTNAEILSAQTAAYFAVVPPGGFPGVYSFALKLTKTGSPTLVRLRVPYTDEAYSVNILQPGGQYAGWSDWEPHQNTTGARWYVKAVSFFHSNGGSSSPAGTFDSAIYVLNPNGTVKTGQGLVSQTFNGTDGYTGPAPVQFTTPIVVEPGEWLVSQARTEGASPFTVDTAFYMFVDSNP